MPRSVSELSFARGGLIAGPTPTVLSRSEQRLVGRRRGEPSHLRTERRVERERVLAGLRAGDVRRGRRGLDLPVPPRLEAGAELRQGCDRVRVLDPVQAPEILRAAEVGAADDPDPVVARPHPGHAVRQLALEARADDCPVSAVGDVEVARPHLPTGRGDVVEVVRPRVDELELPEAVPDRRGVQDLGLLVQVEPGDRVGRVVVGSVHRVLGGAREVADAAELVHGTVGGDVIAHRDAGARLEDPIEVEQRHPVLVRLGAERQSALVVGRGGGGRDRRAGAHRCEGHDHAGRQAGEPLPEAVHEGRVSRVRSMMTGKLGRRPEWRSSLTDEPTDPALYDCDNGWLSFAAHGRAAQVQARRAARACADRRCDRGSPPPA